MFWIVVLVIFAVIAVSLESTAGKIVFGAAVLALGLLLLAWIMDVSFLITLAKVCAVVIVVTIVAALLMAILD